MILLALLLAAGPPAPSIAARYDSCVKLADSDAQAAIASATKWAGDGGGIPAGQCLGLARVAAGDWKGAADAFAATADIAEQTSDGRAANLLVSAGNAALAGGDYARAREALTRAVALPALTDPMKGEAYLDRARASVAEDKPADARADIDQALTLVPGDPMAWLLSATLARRMDDPARAAKDIAEADRRAPNEPAILLERGTIAAAAGDMAAARTAWTQARAADPASDAGLAAQKALEGSGGIPKAAVREGR